MSQSTFSSDRYRFRLSGFDGGVYAARANLSPWSSRGKSRAAS